MRSVLVTGASSGIGAATALHLDREGFRVFAAVEHEAGASELAGASSNLHRLTLDVTSQESIDAAVAAIERDNGGLDGLVNNAGIGVPGPLELLPIEDLRRQLEVNVIGQVAVTQALLPSLRGANGRIVFVGSIGGILASQFAGAYHASKFAIEAIGDVWRQELDPEDIPVILVEPTTIATPIWEKAIAYLDALTARDSPRLAPYRDRLEGFRDTLESADEHGKPADDVAEVIAKALTDEKPNSRYVVGTGAKIAAALRPLAPDRLVDKLTERTTS